MRSGLYPALIAIAGLLSAAAACADSLRDPTRPYGAGVAAAASTVQFKVSAILISDDRRVAIVNGRRVTEGDQIGDATVIEIMRDRLRLDYRGTEITTRLTHAGLPKQK